METPSSFEQLVAQLDPDARNRVLALPQPVVEEHRNRIAEALGLGNPFILPSPEGTSPSEQ